ncbi:DEAD/DEAH box helicase family protein [Acinetobacter sp. R933-2]|uniref:DEAD/DEAH box helicase n=1 Tax=Acinetobacter sp. R933-2 TaxID=2746728 RepID=UPI0025791DDD|nr:DEAD/DEAH box helicase [Acinetobacter sp. R933-2]MDM1248496.1 DEAD/DEAH box helicase family protein [Acinetobacter sp. R933-2]
MLKKSYVLEKNQYLADLNLKTPASQFTFLVAPTGIGKTTFTMEELKHQFELVVILVPTQNKVSELKNHYDTVTSKYLFFYGNHSPDESVRSFKGVIVATYDKFDKIMGLMTPSQKSKALLVVDEAHKLYSAGSFRDDALTPVLWHLQNRTIPSALCLTATKTDELFNQLKIKVDHEYVVEHSDPIVRNIEVISLLKGDQYTSIAVIEKRIKQLKKEYEKLPKNHPRKTMLVRVNSREKCHNFRCYFEKKYKLKCLVVHSKSKNDSEVREIFESQKIPQGIDIVFTTSIMDEAVNLNNEQVEIDSVFVIGKQAHVEELVQFIGRLRLANVPCCILLHTEILQTNQNIETVHQKHLKMMDEFITRVYKIGEGLSSLVHDYKFYQNKEKIQNIYDKINHMNESFKDWFDCKLFTVYNGKSIQNIASLVSTLYQMDTGHIYSSFEYLAWRIKKFLPNSEITFIENNELETPQHVKDFFDEQKSLSDQAYTNSIDLGISMFLDEFQSSTFMPKTLKEISDKFIQTKQKNEDYIDDLVLFAGDDIPHHEQTARVLNETIYLAQHISNLHDIKEILIQKRFSEISKVAEAYAKNEFVRHMLRKFYGRTPEKYLFNGHKITGTQASTLLANTIKAVQKHTYLPMHTIIKERLIKGMHYDYKTDEIEVATGKALNFIATYFEVKDRNKNKPEKRYLEFHGIAVGGFEYLHIHNLQNAFIATKVDFELNGKRYAPYSGQVIKGK